MPISKNIQSSDLEELETQIKGAESQQTYTNRWYCQPDERWVTWHNNYGCNNRDANSSQGTATEPANNANQTGLYIPEGRTLKTLHIVTRANSGQLQNYDLHLYHKTIDANGLALFNLIYTASDITLQTHQTIYTATINHHAPTNGFLCLSLKGKGNLSRKRYIYTTTTFSFSALTNN